MLDVVWDMETGDPDDFITLLFLLGHPDVNLKAVTITPGTPDQVGLVRHALECFGRSIPVGAHNLDHLPPSMVSGAGPGEGRHGRRGVCVSSWHYKSYGDIPPSRDALPGGELLHAVCDDATTLITGAPLKNLGAAMQRPGFRLGRLVAQGGFAGAGVVPPALQLAKFRDLVTCPTYNLNGDPRSALAALEHLGIGVRRFVAKNVCHGVVYDHDLHARVVALRDVSRSHRLIAQGMAEYLRKHKRRGATADDPAGKKFHDPLAACCAIDEQIGVWAEVELFRERGEWGARPRPGSGTWIIIDYDRARFMATFLAHAAA
jgi:inosine-uridine nucleoside N-ribohydrolase